MDDSPTDRRLQADERRSQPAHHQVIVITVSEKSTIYPMIQQLARSDLSQAQLARSGTLNRGTRLNGN
jgi:hypothetical protein